MIDFKVSGIAAGIAFVLSLIIGVFSGIGFLDLLLRALVFAGVFFALSGLGFWVVSRFLPELLSEGGGSGGGGGDDDEFDIAAPGSRVDISVGSSVEGAFPEDASDAVDDIAGRPSAVKKQSVSPLDQNEESGYNEERGFTGDFDGLTAAESSDGIQAEALPDMGDLSGESDDDDVDDLGMDGFDPPPEQPQRSSSKKPAIAGDFDPKELAQAIRTVLKKEEKG